MHPTAIGIIPIAKSRIRLVNHFLLNRRPAGADLKQLCCRAPARFASGQRLEEIWPDLVSAEVNAKRVVGIPGLLCGRRWGLIAVGHSQCGDALLIRGVRPGLSESKGALCILSLFCHGPPISPQPCSSMGIYDRPAVLFVRASMIVPSRRFCRDGLQRFGVHRPLGLTQERRPSTLLRDHGPSSGLDRALGP